MKNSMINTTHIEGLLYQHALTLRTSGESSKNPGTQYINGTIDIATDDKLLNIVSVHFTYVTAKTAKGNANATFDTLQNIINGVLKNVTEHGADVAAKLRIDSSIGLNEFYSNRSGADELVSIKRNEGGFVHVTQAIAGDETLRDTFKCDMIITGMRRIEADEEHGRPERGVVKGYIFDFRKPKAVGKTACTDVRINFSDSYYSTFTYDKDKKVYYKTHTGKPHMDARANEQLHYTNVFILETDVGLYKNGPLVQMDWKGGTGYYLSYGTVRKIKWSKKTQADNIVVTDSKGNNIPVNRGNSYIAVTDYNTTVFPE